MPVRFSPTQITLHWLVALLVLAQFLNDSAISRAFRDLTEGVAVAPNLAIGAHIAAGLAILGLALWRVGLRLTRRAPPAPPQESRVLRLVAAATHGLLYLLLLLLPISGLVAWFGGVGPAGAAHSLMTTLLLGLVGLHVAGAVYQRLVLRSDVLGRMLPFAR